MRHYEIFEVLMANFCGAMNLKHHGLLPFCNFNFNSFCRFNGKLYGATVDGLYQISGDTDDGAPISCHVDTPVSDWGTDRVKRVRYLLVSAEADGSLQLSVLDRLDNSIGTQNVDASGIQENPAIFRTTFGKKSNGRFFKFRISNVAGSFISINAMSAFFISRPHGTSKNK